jgi:hypothetical protein
MSRQTKKISPSFVACIAYKPPIILVIIALIFTVYFTQVMISIGEAIEKQLERIEQGLPFKTTKPRDRQAILTEADVYLFLNEGCSLSGESLLGALRLAGIEPKSHTIWAVRNMEIKAIVMFKVNKFDHITEDGLEVALSYDVTHARANSSTIIKRLHFLVTKMARILKEREARNE